MIFPEEGSSLIEVLVSLVLFSVTLLGIVSLQHKGMQLITDSGARGSAIVLAQSMSERIKSNPGATDIYAGSLCSTLSCVDGDGTTLSSSVDCRTSSCTSEQVAHNDILSWRNQLQNDTSALPAAQGQIVSNSEFWTIRVFWNDARLYGESMSSHVAASTLDCNADSASSLQCYQLRFAL